MKWACTIRNWYNGAVSGNQKMKLQCYPNSVFFPSNNEKRTTYAQRNLLKREQSKPEHQASKHHVEVGTNSLHLNTATYIAPSPRQQSCPAAADNPGVRRWSPEDGGEGLRRVLLLRPLVRRKATIKSTRMTWYSPLVKQKQTTKAKRSLPYKITKDISQTQPDKQTASQIGKRNKPTASHK